MEHALNWQKSSYSGAPNNECVECAVGPDRVAVRDSKHPEHPHLVIAPEAWSTFTNAVARSWLGG